MNPKAFCVETDAQMTDTTELDQEAFRLAAIDVLNAARDVFESCDGMREFEVRLADDGTVSLWLPDGSVHWKGAED